MGLFCRSISLPFRRSNPGVTAQSTLGAGKCVVLDGAEPLGKTSFVAVTAVAVTPSFRWELWVLEVSHLRSNLDEPDALLI